MTIERDALKKEKEEQLALLNDKLSTMEKSYETILQVNAWLCVMCSTLHTI